METVHLRCKLTRFLKIYKTDLLESLKSCFIELKCRYNAYSKWAHQCEPTNIAKSHFALAM